MEGILKIATRGSRLALKQYEIISKELEMHGVKSEPVVVKPYGERDTKSPLYEMKEQGVFVRALNDQVLEGRVEAAVHSAKDLPTEIDPGLNISYFSRRADPRDYFVSRASIDDFKGTVGSSSMRRKVFLGLYSKGMRFENIRGNVDTRVMKWEKGDFDSIVVAKAALDRLELSPPGQAISETICPPDPNQGFIAVVTKRGSKIENTFRKIQDQESLWEASRERNLMVRLQLGCNTAASIRAVYSYKVVKFAYANEEGRFDYSFNGEIEESSIRKLRDIVDS